MSADLDDLFAAWSAGDLDADGLRRLETALGADPIARERFAQWCQTDVALRTDLRLAGGAAVPLPGPNQARGRSRRGRIHRRRQPSGRSYAPFAVAAAVLALVVVLVVAVPGKPSPSPSPGLAVLVQTTGTVAADDQVVNIGADLPAGARIEAVEGLAVLRLADGTEVDLGEGTTLVLDSPDRLRLRTGLVTCRVAAQGAGRFIIDAPFAEAAVVGTVFSVEAGRDETLVQVDEGRVRVRPRAGGERVLGAGDKAAVTVAGFRTGAAPAPIIGFQVIDAQSDRPVGAIVALGEVLPVPGELRGKINVRIDAGPEVASLRISGGPRGSRLEAILPFSLFSDRDGDYDGQVLPSGDHVFRIRAYGDVDGRQALGDPIALTVRVP